MKCNGCKNNEDGRCTVLLDKDGYEMQVEDAIKECKLEVNEKIEKMLDVIDRCDPWTLSLFVNRICGQDTTESSIKDDMDTYTDMAKGTIENSLSSDVEEFYNFMSIHVTMDEVDVIVDGLMSDPDGYDMNIRELLTKFFNHEDNKVSKDEWFKWFTEGEGSED